MSREPETVETVMCPVSSSIMDVAPAPGPVARRPLAGARDVVRAFSNLVEAWPEDVYREPIVAGRLLGRPVTYVVDPECIRTLLVDEADKLVRDDAMTRALAPILGTGLLTSDGPAWRTQRRAAAPAFRPDRVAASIPAIADAARATLRRWEEAPRQGVVDLQSEMMRTAFDVVVGTMLGGDAGLDPARFGRALDGYLKHTNWKIAYGVLGAPAWLPHPGSARAAKASRDLRGMAARVVAGRRDRRDGCDVLGALLSAVAPDTGLPLSDRELVDNLLTFVVAGHETTALVLAWTLRLIAEHPGVQRRMLDEIAGVPSPVDDPGAVDRLVFCRQVVCEAMRLYPPAALLVRRAAVDLKVGGLRIPAGGSLHIPIYALHRHRRLWNDPETFDPDRFAPDRQRLRHRFAFLPFGGGPRVCIGMGMAITECLVILAGLLPRFGFGPLEAAPLPRAHLRVTLRPIGGMPVRVEPRNAQPRVGG